MTGAGSPPVLARSASAVVGGLIRSARPRQWIKNVLVFAAPATAGVLTNGTALREAAVAFTAFCLVASGTYLVNDVLDVHDDRLHPRKRARAIASGVVPLPLAASVGAALMAIGIAAGAAFGRPLLVAVLCGYVALTLAYSIRLRHVAVIDLVAVASGFLLRTIAGGVSTHVRLSQWFLIVATSGSIYLVAGKRHAEHIDLGEDRGAHRRTLDRYPLSYLAHVRAVSSAVAVVAYCLWAINRGPTGSVPWAALSIGAVVIGLLRYELLVEEGHGGAPEEVLRRDRSLQVLGLIWVGLLLAAVYGR